MLVSLERVCVVYVVRKVTSISRGGGGGLSQLMAWRIIELVLELYRGAGRKLLVGLLPHVETGSNS